MGLRSLLAGEGKDSKSKANSPPKPPNVNLQYPPSEIQIYSHNIRQDAENPQEHEKPWALRREGVCASIHYTSQTYPTLVALQEVKQNQLHDILFGLGSGWSYFGVGRDDGQTKGEITPILYKESEWELLQRKTIWLSETPSKPSKGWDAACNRTVTTVTLRHRSSHKEVNLFNTHLDHIGKAARVQSANQISQLISSYNGTSLLCGDFNSQIHEEPYRIIRAKGLDDASAACKSREGFKHTFTGFAPDDIKTTIDFIWAGDDATVMKYEIMTNDYNSFYVSDHRPVTAVIQI